MNGKQRSNNVTEMPRPPYPSNRSLVIAQVKAESANMNAAMLTVVRDWACNLLKFNEIKDNTPLFNELINLADSCQAVRDLL